MRIVRDSDTLEFRDPDGDRLIVRSSPTQRDVIGSDEIERDDAILQLDNLKRLGLDTDAILADAQNDPDALAKAQEAANVASPRVREFRLKALAVKLIVSGEVYGGEAIVAAYRDMDPASAAWVDAQVEGVWTAASLSDADTRPASVVPAMPERAAD